MDINDYLNTKNKLKELISKRMDDLIEEKRELEEKIKGQEDLVTSGILNRKVGEIDKLIEINFNFLSKISKLGEANEEVH